MSTHSRRSSATPSQRFASSGSDDFYPPPDAARKRRFTATTDDGLFFIPGEYRLSGETNCYPWVHVEAGLCIVTRDTGFAPGTYDVDGTVKYDTHEELVAADPKFASRRWARKGVAGQHYSGVVECRPVALTGAPVKMINEVDDPQATDPHATHRYHMAGFSVVKKRRTDVPGLTLVVRDPLPARNKYRVEGRVTCQEGATELHGMSLIPLRRTNVGRFRLNGKVYLSLSEGPGPDSDGAADADAGPAPPPAPAPSPPLSDDDGSGKPGPAPPPHKGEPVAEKCKCRPFTR